RYFNRYLTDALQHAGAGQWKVALFLCDIVDFKNYNDTLGYLSGDKILKETGQILQAHVHTPGIVARIGGDEFAVVFLEAENAAAQEQFLLAAEQKLRKLIQVIS